MANADAAKTLTTAYARAQSFAHVPSASVAAHLRAHYRRNHAADAQIGAALGRGVRTGEVVQSKTPVAAHLWDVVGKKTEKKGRKSARKSRVLGHKMHTFSTAKFTA